jgi:DNA-binding response OmpR family regulator
MPAEQSNAKESTSDETPSLKTVVIVDSEIIVRMTLGDYLRNCGYKVIEAANGEEALTILKDSDVNVDVVLAEVVLGGEVDGFQLAAWIRHRRPQIAVILTGTPGKAAKAAGDLCEEGPMMAKPYDPQLVLDRIKRLLSVQR